MQFLFFPVFFTLLPTIVLGFGHRPCYYANGTQTRSEEVRQCSNGVSTICCTLNRENKPGSELNETGGWTQDECLPNGLCQNRHMYNGVSKTNWWLEYCTNPDPTTRECLDVCRQTRDSAGGSRMTPCGESGDGSYNALLDERETTRWCCGDSDACCTNNIGVVELPKKFTGRAIKSSISLPSPSPTSSRVRSSQTLTQISSTQISSTQISSTQISSTQISSTQISLTPSPTPTESKAPEAEAGGLSPGLKATIGVGAAVGISAILLAAFFGHKTYEYRKQAKQRETQESYALQADIYGAKHIYAHSGFVPSELSPISPPAELPSPHPFRSPSELPLSETKSLPRLLTQGP
ncbi:hypothetical protein BU23DRAFT_31531 [Bimuria novae-zelandiae CBS 107.79]|uniref:Mid2 domain-containing protein n=1 Tax=Bimuria novae-zelandiae CBS 107.79 TaxID=1447943 RepID=A0A6A5VJP3_9PLEO|nr:hypothetical protein BU23DRAFT_31531 [Bimuria novae-zelandiae CBS 107.79]